MTSNIPDGSEPDGTEPQDVRGPSASGTAKRPRRWLVRLVAALVALLVAFLVGRFTAPKPTVNASPAAAQGTTASPSPDSGAGAQAVVPNVATSSAGTADPNATTTSTATVGPAATGLDSVSLADLAPVSGTFNNNDKSPVINGKSQLYALSASLDSCSDETTGDAQYNLGRDYTQLTALLGVDDNSAAQNAAPSVEIDGDGHKLGTWTPTLGKSDPISVNVTDVLRLDIKWTDPGITCESYAVSYLVVGNGQLTPVPGFVTPVPSGTAS